tara:strand:+ start:842 stop:1396 length:555 start_codon:yes stop_codon:yes gene_type:complete
MISKNRLRKKYFILRKKKFFEIKSYFFKPLVKFILKRFKNKNTYLSLYYPSLFELNVLKLLELEQIVKIKILLPVLAKNKTMRFYRWTKNEILYINQFGMLEPSVNSKHVIPDIMLVPLLAYDENNNRLGYGGGFYDKYLNTHSHKKKDIVTVGTAFSFQKTSNLPTTIHDVKLDYILNEKGMY